MQRFLPDVGDEHLDDLYRDLEIPAGTDRPHLYLDMVSSADGAATLEGRTEGLGGAADALAFRRLRATCDAILVGAGTVRTEKYGPPHGSEDRRRARLSRGLAAIPDLIVVSASCRLDPDLPIFSDPDLRPLVLTVEDAPTDLRGALEQRADVLVVGRGGVDLPAGLALLRSRGITRLLCEGGPTLNASLLRAGLVDELFLTLSPQLVGVEGPRIVQGSIGSGAIGLDLRELRHHEGELLLRYARSTPAAR